MKTDENNPSDWLRAARVRLLSADRLYKAEGATESVIELLHDPAPPHFELDSKPVQVMIPSMSSVSYTEARDRLASIWDDAVESREPVIISRRGSESVVLVPLDEWSGLLETAHLLRSPTNARRLLSALRRLEAGRGRKLTMEQLAEKAGK